ncbi:MAG: lipocalin family protein [Leptospiraceae bacterium]|nr:lipocalin family protein [Leptospiraceae bacterium]
MNRFKKFNFMKIVFLLFVIVQCKETEGFRKTVPSVDLNRFMGKWYVIASRPTSFEENAFNAVEIYTYNSQKDQIDISFNFNKGSLTGPKKSIPQTGYIIDKINNSYWKVSPFWPLKFDYLIIDLDPSYKWTVIGVPDQTYIWIMARTPTLTEAEFQKIISRVDEMGYNSKNLVKVTNSF